MTYRVNQFVEVEGDQNDPGFRDSWSKYKVLTAPRHGRVRVQSLEFLAEDATNGELLVEVKQLSQIRPCLEDDSQLVPLIARHCGDAVDVEKDGCWWTGRVGQCYDDHITVIFPNASVIEDPYPIWQPPRQPNFYRARTTKHFNRRCSSWEHLPKLWYPQCEDKRATKLLQSTTSTMLPHQGSKRLKRSKVDKRHRSETPVLEDKPTLQLAKLKSHRKHHGEHSSDDLVGGNDSQASKDKDTLLQIASSSSSSQACRSGALPLLEDTRMTNPKQGILSSNKKPKFTELVEDDLWLESNTGKQICAQTLPRNTKNIEIERGNSRLPHGKPALSLLNRQASTSSMTALKSKNGHFMSNDEKSSVLLHKQAKKQASMSGVFALAQELEEVDGAATNQLMSKTRQPNTSLMEGKTTRWSLGTSKRASSSSLLQSQASAGANHDTTGNGQRDSLGMNHREAKKVDGKANALVASSQQMLKQRKMTSHGGVPHVAASKARQLPLAAQFLREPSTLGADSLESAPSGFSSSILPANTSRQSVMQPKQRMVKEANRQEFEVANTVKQGSKHFAKHDMSDGFLPLEAQVKRSRSSRRASTTSHILCIDYIGGHFETKHFEMELRKLVDGIEEVYFESVPLGGDAYTGGWAAVHFIGDEDASAALERLQSLCMWQPHIPFPLPLIVHSPHWTMYPWGSDPFPLGYVTKVECGHFMQPNSLEFGPAQEWRALELSIVDLKGKMLKSHETELAKPIQWFCAQERGVQVAQAIPKQPPLPSTHLWLKGLPPKHACVDDVRVAFCQWLGDNESPGGGDLVVQMLKNPVTQCYTGHAVVKMQSHKQAEWVASDLNEMIFTVSMGPRPLQASVAQAGGPHGAMATMENALSSVLGHQSLASGKGLSKLGLVHEANSKEEALTQTLRQLMMQHTNERLQFKKRIREWQQELHQKHALRFQEEFDKFARAAQVNRSEPMLAQQNHVRLRRHIPNLFEVMLHREDAKPPTPLQLKMQYHA